MKLCTHVGVKLNFLHLVTTHSIRQQNKAQKKLAYNRWRTMSLVQVTKSIINCIHGEWTQVFGVGDQSIVNANGSWYCAKIGFVSIMLISLLWLMKSVDVNLDSIWFWSDLCLFHFHFHFFSTQRPTTATTALLFVKGIMHWLYEIGLGSVEWKCFTWIWLEHAN